MFRLDYDARIEVGMAECKTWYHIEAGFKAEYCSVSVNGGEGTVHENRFSGCPLHPMTICGSKNKNLIIRTER